MQNMGFKNLFEIYKKNNENIEKDVIKSEQKLETYIRHF